MTRWAWVIDQTRCIGCHACTTACKSENHVALGVFRTWVKNVDVGTFPDVRRHFAVLRCNHCEDAPCVEICPVTAMYQRDDGLVDFDESLCIGCKACMQACPYDAIYMDPDSDTAAKCNFCSHRVDQQLLPACVVVCPVEALLFGDMDDPASKVARALAEQRVTVRRPEQRTRPKAFYIGAHEAALDPLAAEHGVMYAWADGRADAQTGRRASSGRPPVVAYDVPRQRTWGWKVSAYIWTKGLAAGLALVPAAMRLAGRPVEGHITRHASALSLIFLVLTGVLLVADLKRPERFWTILVRPQWRSWLARGAFLITLFGALLVPWTLASWLEREALLNALAWPVAIVALLVAAYTAFLFAQCEGRDLWQSRLMLPHLVLHAVVLAICVLLLVVPPEASASLAPVAGLALLGIAVLALADAFGSHRTTNAAAAARALARGAQARLFWMCLALGMALPALILATGHEYAALASGSGLALIGLLLHGHAVVLAGQGPPIS